MNPSTMPSLFPLHLSSTGIQALVGPHWTLPYALPPAGTTLRLAFVGQSTCFEACALGDECHGIETIFVDFRAGGDVSRMLALVAGFDPHVVVAFRPEIVPVGAFRTLTRTATVGFLTEPLPRRNGRAHPDLRRRLEDLEATDAASFDRLISFDPLLASSAGVHTPIWRSVPLPVADALYAPVRPGRAESGVLFVGRSTPHREQYLADAKHQFDLVHVPQGVDGPSLRALLRENDAVINLHNESYPTFENRVCLHLAAGHLVISEPLSPTHGLEPGIDFLEVRKPRELLHALSTIRHHPRAFDRIRYRGRAKAEQFRASQVYPRVLHDLYLDLAAYGTSRRTDQV